MSEHRYVPHPEDVRDADAELGRLCAHGRLKTIRCPECAGGAPAVPSEAAIEAVREQARYYAPFTPLTDDEVKRGAAALQRELGEWGCDRMHAQWARLVLGNAEHCIREAVGSLAPAPSGPPDEIAWLIEGVASGHPVWWTGKWYPRFAPIVFGPLHSTLSHPTSRDDMEPIFSPEHLEAMRFARQEDAVRAIDLLPVFYRSCVKATEHIWVARLAAPGEGTKT